MIKIFIDPGHGGNDPGAVANGLLEKHLTLDIAHYLRDYLLKNYQNISIKLSRSSDKTVTLNERTNHANTWGADMYLSLHINAGGGKGFESYIFNGNFPGKSRTNQIRSAIHDTLIAEMDWVNRGKKEANFHVLRETKMPAILTESGFIDHRDESRLMRNDDWLQSLAVNHGKGIANALNLTENSRPKIDDPLYRVISGSYLEEENARKKVDQLRKHGYESYILPSSQHNQRYYRVVVGAFRQRENANGRVKALQEAGYESFILEV